MTVEDRAGETVPAQNRRGTLGDPRTVSLMRIGSSAVEAPIPVDEIRAFISQPPQIPFPSALAQMKRDDAHVRSAGLRNRAELAAAQAGD